jgi:hypothetical protein
MEPLITARGVLQCNREADADVGADVEAAAREHGTTFSALRNDVLLHRALRLLNKARSVTEVAAQLG